MFGRRAYGPPVLFPSASDLTIRKATGAVGYPLSLRSQWELHVRPLQFLVIAVAQAELNLREETFEAVKQSEALHPTAMRLLSFKLHLQTLRPKSPLRTPTQQLTLQQICRQRPTDKVHPGRFGETLGLPATITQPNWSQDERDAV